MSDTLSLCPPGAGRDCKGVEPPTLTLYTRAGCPLCEEMESEIQVLIVGTRHRLARVDVDADPSLKARYGWEVPLLFHGDTELCRHELNLAVFQDWLHVRG